MATHGMFHAHRAGHDLDRSSTTAVYGCRYDPTCLRYSYNAVCVEYVYIRIEAALDLGKSGPTV